jgi:hypothetical protein
VARAAREKAAAGGQLSMAEVLRLEPADVLEALNQGALADLGCPPSKRRR